MSDSIAEDPKKVIHFRTRQAYEAPPSVDPDKPEEPFVADEHAINTLEALLEKVRDGTIRSFVTVAWDPSIDDFEHCICLSAANGLSPEAYRFMGGVMVMNEQLTDFAIMGEEALNMEEFGEDEG